jgi:hypothetical protein
MISLLSIHIPKAAGTSFYEVLAQVYGHRLSPSLRRRYINTWLDESNEQYRLQHDVWHGHIRFLEAEPYCNPTKTKIITWLRHPVERVYSNYLFFQSRLQDPTINPEIYALNKHRLGESLLDYASLPENQNRMSWFLEGIQPSNFFFIGDTAFMSRDLMRLREKLGWKITPALGRLNMLSTSKPQLSIRERETLEALNEEDMQWFTKALEIYKP